MYAVHTEEYYVLPMLDHSEYQPWQKTSLDKMVTEVYGQTYVGQQTGDMLSNDSDHIWNMTEREVEQLIYDDEQFEGYESPFDGSKMLPLRKWLALDPADFKYDFEHYRLAPTPDVMLAYLIKDGHLPHGKYLIRVSW